MSIDTLMILGAGQFAHGFAVMKALAPSATALATILDILGLAVAAVSGTLAARNKNLDLFGVPAVALVTCFGGGTLRDLLLGRKPLVWMGRPWLIALVLGTAVLTLIIAHFWRIPERSLLIADAIALGYFALVGTKITLLAGAPPVAAILLGTMSGVAGGALRDVLCGDVPMIFGGQIYALAALSGAATFVVLNGTRFGSTNSLLLGIGITIAVRCSAIVWNLKVPKAIFDPAGDTIDPGTLTENEAA